MPKLTKSIVDAIPYPETGQKFYRDSAIKGFGLRVGTGSKVYIAEGTRFRRHFSASNL